MEVIRTEATHSKFYDVQEENTMQSYAEYLELKGERRVIVRLGTSLFGPPDATMLGRLEAIESPEVLEELGVRVSKATSWEEALSGLK